MEHKTMMTSLISAVAAQMGYDLDEKADRIEFLQTCRDVCNGGADGGFSGFVYYTETRAFFSDNERLIMRMAREMADEFGQGLSEFIASFNCLREYKVADVDAWREDDADGDTACQIENALAWFTLEEVARYVMDNEEELETDEEETEEEETDE
jgi:hypothetical protein